MSSKNIVIIILALILIGAVGYLVINNDSDVMVDNKDTEMTTPDDVMPVEPDGGIGDSGDPLSAQETNEGETLLGQSVNGESIMAYHFGQGGTEIMLIGGVHGGYSANTIGVTNEAIKYFKENEAAIPDNVTLTIIPLLNPDGAKLSGAAGRFNANNVDLNRNFDCEWSATSMWRNEEVSGGTGAFSEPEARALRDYVLTKDPSAAIVWFSAEGKVYPSACGSDPSSASLALADKFATAAGYPTQAEFDAYAITGDMVNWMAKQGIPSISVLLTDHTNTEWNKNLAGIETVLKTYAQ